MYKCESVYIYIYINVCERERYVDSSVNFDVLCMLVLNFVGPPNDCKIWFNIHRTCQIANQIECI